MTSPRRTDWTLVILLWLAGLLAAAQFGKISLSLGLLDSRYPGAGAVLPFVVSVVGITGIVLGPVAGGLITRAGIRKAVIAALLLGACLSLVQAGKVPFPLFLATRILEGVSHLTLVVALPTLMAEVSSDRDRPVVMGLWGTFFGVSFALLAVVLPALDGAGGLPLVYASHGVALGVMAVVLFPRLPRGRGERVPFRLFAELRAIYSEPRLIAPALIFVWHALVFIALLTFLPEALGQCWLAVVLPIVSLAGTFGAGVLARTIAPARIAVLAFAVNAVLCVAMLALPSVRVPLSVLMFLSIGAVPGAGFAAIPWLNAALGARARANGALAQLGNVGTFSGTPLFALALGAGDATGLIALTLVVALLGLTISLAISRKFRQVA